jgi:cobalamin-dependent methionine synthase I
VLNSVFLHHCVEAGLDMAIVNPAHVQPYAEIPADERALADDLVFNKRPTRCRDSSSTSRAGRATRARRSRRKIRRPA